MHAGAGLDEGASHDDEPAEHISVDAALILFVIPTGLDLAFVHQHSNHEAGLGLEVACMANGLGKVGKLGLGG